MGGEDIYLLTTSYDDYSQSIVRIGNQITRLGTRPIQNLDKQWLYGETSFGILDYGYDQEFKDCCE